MLNGPDPAVVFPVEHHQKLVFLKNIITRKNIEVGDFTYYDDFIDPLSFEKTYYIILILLVINSLSANSVQLPVG